MPINKEKKNPAIVPFEMEAIIKRFFLFFFSWTAM